MPASASSKKGKKSQPKSGGQKTAPRLNVPSLIPKAAAAVPTTTSAFSSPEPDSASTTLMSSSRRLRASPSSSTINSIEGVSSGHLNVSTSLSQLLGPEGSPAGKDKHRPSSIASLKASPQYNSPATHLLSASTSSTASASPAATFLSISPPSPRKHTQEVELDTSFESPSHQDKSGTLMASPLSAGAGGALKSLQRVASRDKLQKEQASKKEQKKAQQRSKSGLHAKERVGSTTASSATSENESGPLNASSPRHRIDLSGPQESAKHQMSAHAEADRLIESDRIEAEHLESHVIKHQGDQLPPPTQQTSASQSEQLSAAFMPQYQVRQTRNHRKTENGEEPEHKSKTDLVSSAHDQPGSTSIEQDEPDPIAARKTKQSWHAQLEADRARVGAAIGDMVISRGQPGDRHANRGNHDGAGWRRWRLDDRSAEIKAAVSSGAAGTPQLGLVWHGPGLGLPGRLSDMSVAVKNRIFGQGGDRQHADGSQQRSQPGVMHLAGVRLPFGLPLPHSLVEWTTAALGAGVGLQVLTWALGGNEQ